MAKGKKSLSCHVFPIYINKRQSVSVQRILHPALVTISLQTCRIYSHKYEPYQIVLKELQLEDCDHQKINVFIFFFIKATLTCNITYLPADSSTTQLIFLATMKTSTVTFTLEYLPLIHVQMQK